MNKTIENILGVLRLTCSLTDEQLNEITKVLYNYDSNILTEDRLSRLVRKTKSNLTELFYEPSASDNEKTKVFEIIQLDIGNYLASLRKTKCNASPPTEYKTFPLSSETVIDRPLPKRVWGC